MLLSSLAVPRAAGAQTPIFATWVSATSSPKPSARCHQYASAFTTSQAASQLFMFGGLTASGPVDDVWTASITDTSATWSQLSFPSGLSPSPRYGHAGVTVTSAVPQFPGATEQSVWLFGGVDEQQRYLDDIWTFSSSSPYFTQVRRNSWDAIGSGNPFTLQSTSPSPRAFSSWKSVSVQLDVLRALPEALDTYNLLLLLNSSAVNNASQWLLLLGGRSSPSSILSTVSSPDQQPASYLNSDSLLNTDYGDWWLYQPASNVWIRLGNASCQQSFLQCSDLNTVANVSQGSVSSLLTQLTAEALAPSRPAQLLNNTQALLSSADSLSALLRALEQQLQLNASITTNPPGACEQVCIDPQETPSPVVPLPDSDFCSGPNPGVLTGSGALLCNSTSAGLIVTQQRPNASEGHAADYLIVYSEVEDGLVSTSYYWQFGGFSCASGGVVSIFTVSNWPSSCFSSSLFLLDPTTLVWYEFSLPAAPNAQQLLWPAPRCYASMAIDQEQQQLWLYGGATVAGSGWFYFNDLHAFDVGSQSWLQVSVTGVQAMPGVGAALVWLPASEETAAGVFLFGGCSPIGSNEQFLILQTSASLTAANWLASGTGLEYAIAGAPAVFSLQAESIFNNGSFSGLLPYGVGLSSLFTVRVEVLSDGLDIETVIGTVTERGSGLYTCNFTLTFGSAYDVQLQVFFGQPNAQLPIPGSPFNITLLPAAYSSANTAAVGSNYSTVEKGAEAIIVLQLEDAFGNRLQHGPPISTAPSFSLAYAAPSTSFSASSQLTTFAYGDGNEGDDNSTTGSGPVGSGGSSGAAFGAQLTPLVSSWMNNGDGTYTVDYTAPSLSSFLLYVRVNGQGIQGSPFGITGLDPLVLPTSIQTAFVVLSVLLAAVVLLLLAVIVWQRDHPVVRASSSVFLCLICVGELLCIGSVVVLAYPSSTSCRLFPFLLTTGYILALSALFSKSYRVLVLFSPSSALSRVVLTDSRMLLPVFVLVCLESCLNLAWLISSPLSLQSESVSAVLSYHACTGSHATAFIAASTAFNSAVCMAGVALAVKIRQVPEAFNESKLMAAALYNIALMLLIAVPLTWTAQDTYNTHEDFLIPAACILWACLITASLTVAPKLYYVMYPPPASYFDASYPQQGGVVIKGVKGRAAPVATPASASSSAVPSNSNSSRASQQQRGSITAAMWERGPSSSSSQLTEQPRRQTLPPLRAKRWGPQPIATAAIVASTPSASTQTAAAADEPNAATGSGDADLDKHGEEQRLQAADVEIDIDKQQPQRQSDLGMAARREAKQQEEDGAILLQLSPLSAEDGPKRGRHSRSRGSAEAAAEAAAASATGGRRSRPSPIVPPLPPPPQLQQQQQHDPLALSTLLPGLRLPPPVHSPERSRVSRRDDSQPQTSSPAQLHAPFSASASSSSTPSPPTAPPAPPSSPQLSASGSFDDMSFAPHYVHQRSQPLLLPPPAAVLVPPTRAASFNSPYRQPAAPQMHALSFLGSSPAAAPAPVLSSLSLAEGPPLTAVSSATLPLSRG